MKEKKRKSIFQQYLEKRGCPIKTKIDTELKTMLTEHKELKRVRKQFYESLDDEARKEYEEELRKIKWIVD